MTSFFILKIKALINKISEFNFNFKNKFLTLKIKKKPKVIHTWQIQLKPFTRYIDCEYEERDKTKRVCEGISLFISIYC